MFSYHLKKILLGSILATMAMALWAVPNSIRFQGRLTDREGNPFPGTSTVIFSLFTTETGGPAAIWNSGPVQVTANSAGLFATDINSVPPTIIAQNPQLYMGITISGVTGPQVLTPRQKLSSVPFAMEAGHAASADTASSLASGAITSDQLADGAVTGIKLSSNSVNSLHIVDGAVAFVDLAPTAVRSSNIQNGTIQAVDLSTSAVRSDNILDGGIDGVDIATDAVTSVNIMDGTVQSEDIADAEVRNVNLAVNAVSTNQIQNGAVVQSKLDPAVVKQLTPSGMIAMFADECPEDWTRFELLDNRFPLGSPTYSQVPQGSNVISGLTTATSGAHSHTVNAHTHDRGTLFTSGGSYPMPVARLSAGHIDIGIQGDTGSSSPPTNQAGNHNHGVNSDGTWLPPHLRVVFCKKD